MAGCDGSSAVPLWQQVLRAARDGASELSSDRSVWRVSKHLCVKAIQGDSLALSDVAWAVGRCARGAIQSSYLARRSGQFRGASRPEYAQDRFAKMQGWPC